MRLVVPGVTLTALGLPDPARQLLHRHHAHVAPLTGTDRECGCNDMSAVLITGSAGLIGSEAAQFYCRRGHLVIGIDNDMRSAVLRRRTRRRGGSGTRSSRTIRSTRTHDVDIRDRPAIERIFREYGADIELVVHAAAQPSHDWAARDPHIDFTVNANGTLTLLEATRQFCPDGRVRVRVDEQGLRRPAERPAADRGGHPLGDRSGPPLPRGHRRDDEHRCDEALAVRRVEDGRRSARPGVRPLLRHEDRLLPRRLPHRPEPLGRAAARVPLVSDAVRRRGHSVHGASATRASRCGTTSTATTTSPPSTSSTGRRASGEVYNIGGGRFCSCSDARSDRALRGDRRQAPARGGTPTRRAPATTSGGSAAPASSASTIPAWTQQYDLRATLEQMLEQHVARWV